MKNVFSLAACIIICIAMVQYRCATIKPGAPLKVTIWDANGYYLYLPSVFIYHDFKQLNWLEAIDKKYGVTGGDGYQAERQANGNYVFKYLGGVAVMELPFFFAGHIIAKQFGYPPDGFSPPYQYALGFGILVYCLLALLLLRKTVLHYFNDITTAITLLLLCLATNFIQYAAVDNGQSHACIFLLYAAVLFTTLKWHQQPRLVWAVLTGYIIGLATSSRPTEAIMLFIPLLWNTQTKEAAKQKWQRAKENKPHIIAAAIAGFAGILPQIIYWKLATGSFIYDVGSKWEFLSPHFRVLFGWEKGWFIYTPVTLFFIAGMFFIKQFPFRKSVLWFCLLNIYIIIAWHDWRYGGSYSTRALVQSYPVFALPLAAFIERIDLKKWRIPFYITGVYLIAVNLFQLVQYNKTILHFNDMNRQYYSHIYLNPSPTPLDMSLLDNDEFIDGESNYNKNILAHIDSTFKVHFSGNTTVPIYETTLENKQGSKTKWLKIESKITAPGCLWRSFLNVELKTGDSTKHARTRLFSPISKNEQTNTYALYISVPEYFAHSTVNIYVSSASDFEGTISKLTITGFSK